MSSAPVIAGVPLAQFAAVTAALAEGFPLRAVLAIEGLDAARWAEADRGWTERLDRDAALLARYQTDLSFAQERLLSRDDPAPEEGGAGKPAPLRAGKARLIRSGTGLGAPSAFASEPVGPRAAAFTAPPAPASPGPAAPPGMGLQVPSAFAGHQVPGSDESTRVAFSVPAEVLPFRALADLEARPMAAIPRIVDPEDEEEDQQATQAAFAVPGEILPFRTKPQPVSTGETAQSRWGLRPAVTMGAPPPNPRPAPAPEAASPPAPPAPQWAAEEEGTRAVIRVPAGGLPFQDAPSRAFQETLERPGAAPGSGSDGSTVALRGVDALRALEVHDGPPLPWVPASRDTGHTHPPETPKPKPPARPVTGHTHPPETPKPPARPAVSPAPAPPHGAAGGPAPRPPARATGQLARAVGPDDAPPMSLERHASLCLEIALDPAHAAEALARYQVTADVKARADEFYRVRIAADPELGAQWSHAYTVYHAWYTSRPRP